MVRKTLLVAVVLAFAVSAFALAQEKKVAKINGFLVDNMCATPHDTEAKKHKTSCSLMEACVKSGYAVVSKDTVYKLDEKGNELALAVLKETKTKQGVAVAVEGTLIGDVLNVDSLIEVADK